METQRRLPRSLPAITLVSFDSELAADIDAQGALASAIVDAARESLLVLDKDLRIVLANLSLCSMFGMNRRDVIGRPIGVLFDQLNGQEFRACLQRPAEPDAVWSVHEIEQNIAGIGRRKMIVSARKLLQQNVFGSTILLALEDITERRCAEHEMRGRLAQKDVLLEEMRHRIANTLQIVASLLAARTRKTHSEETRSELRETYQRIMSIAALQSLLQPSETADSIEVGSYLSRLCETLATSMSDDRPRLLLMVGGSGGTASASQVTNMGLIVTELFINALKHAFPDGRNDGAVVVSYDAIGPSWRLTVSDNGVGQPDGFSTRMTPGLGTTIVEALAIQLEAHIDVSMDSHGTTISVCHEAS